MLYVALHMVFSAGIIFGFPAVVLILEDDGVYAGRCPAGNLTASAAAAAFNGSSSAGPFAFGGGVLLLLLLQLLLMFLKVFGVVVDVVEVGWLWLRFLL